MHSKCARTISRNAKTPNDVEGHILMEMRSGMDDRLNEISPDRVFYHFQTQLTSTLIFFLEINLSFGMQFANRHNEYLLMR